MKIKSKVKINSVEELSELPDAWSKQDYINILDQLGFSEEVSDAEILEMTFMALSDQEPEESAQLLMNYRMSEQLNDGQIQQLSHDMQQDKVPEEYPDIFLHHEFFNINQLLYKAYNGKFPKCRAVVVDMDLSIEPHTLLEDKELLNELILKSLVPAFDGHAVISRLYNEELEGSKSFSDADGIVWKTEVKEKENHAVNILFYTSQYWLGDLPEHGEFEGTIKIVEEEEEDDD